MRVWLLLTLFVYFYILSIFAHRLLFIGSPSIDCTNNIQEFISMDEENHIAGSRVCDTAGLCKLFGPEEG